MMLLDDEANKKEGLTSADDSHTLLNLIEYLQGRERRRQTLIDDFARKQGIFRAQLLDFEKENSGANNAITDLKITVDDKDKEIQRLERRLKAALHKNEMLQKTTTMYENDKRELQYELVDLKKKADREKQDKMKLKTALKGVVSQEKDKWERECVKRVKSKEDEMQAKVWQREEKLRQLKDIVQNMKSDRPVTRSQIRSGVKTERSKSPPPVAKKPIKARHRRSKSDCSWIEHKPSCNLETDNVMQPVLHRKRTVTQPQSRDFVNGEVYETIAGGASVQFTEVETLRTRQQLNSSADRKRRASDGDDQSIIDVETRCAYAIECRPTSGPAYSHTVNKRKKT
jgi:kinesin family protein 23